MPRQAGDYRFGWVFSFLVAIVSAPFIVAFQHSLPWLIAVPIVLGVALIAVSEWKVCAAMPSQEFFESIPKGYSGIKSYEQLVALEIHPPRKSSKNQLPLFEAFPETTAVNSIRTLYDSANKEIAVVNCDRYAALLIAYLIENLDAATEKSLRAGLARFGELGKGRSDIQTFNDKAIRETIKADFRGNLLTLVSKGGERVLKDLLKAVDAIEKEKLEKELEKQKSEKGKQDSTFQLH